MPILNYTTTVAAAKTVSQVQTLLAKHGAGTIAVRYEDGRAAGVTFDLETPHGRRAFTLPVDVEAIYQVLVKQRVQPKYRSLDQAERIAWRIAKDWLEAQLAIIESQMVSLTQVMLPYLHVDGAKTLYQAYEERESALALTSGDGAW